MTHRYWLRIAYVCAVGFGFPLAAAANQIPDAVELQALRQLYTDTNGSGWVDNTNWLQGSTLADAATWTGVTVANGDITGLALTQNQLSGSVSTALGQLGALQSLDLSGNQLTGGFPVELGQLSQLLSLNLSGNLLSGGLPAAIGQLTALHTLVLSYNQFSRGLPTVLGQLLALQTFDVKGNQFTGSLPAALGQMTSLQHVDIAENSLAGALPAAIGQWTNLKYLDCSSNQFTGVLPNELAQLTGLELLKISYNRFSGSLPAQVGQLTNLYYLDATSNLLSGVLPSSVGQLSALQYVYLDGNQFRGDLPAGVSQWTNITELVLSNNQFTGPLPTAMGQWANLAFAQLDNNDFTGAVPAGWGPSTTLQFLLLSNNKFNSIPNFSTNASLILNVSNNQLEFGTLEPNFTGVGTFNLVDIQYRGQLLPANSQAFSATFGQPFTLPSIIGGTLTRYQWQRQTASTWQNITGATSAAYQVASATLQEEGLYRCQATNDWVTGLTLYSRSIRVQVDDAIVSPPSDPSDDLNRNWTLERTFDGDGNVIGEGKQFFDELGRPTQSQIKNQSRKHVFASQVIYSASGKPVLNTLSAPTQNQDFKYKEGFVTAGGIPYGFNNFEQNKANNPDPVDAAAVPGTLGYYYSDLNALEPYTAATAYPYSLVEPYEGPLGGVRRAAGPGDELRMGKGRETKQRTVTLLNDLSHYMSLRPYFVTSSSGTVSLHRQGTKSVSLDVNGRESIVFSDKAGQLLATCQSGPQYSGMTISGTVDADPANTAGQPQYLDIHIPAAGSVAFACTGFGIIVIRDLYTGIETLSFVPNTSTLSPGFYRIKAYIGNQSFSYVARYGSFSYSYYDDAGRSVATVTPKGVDLNSSAMPQFVTRNVFAADGKVLSTSSADEGTDEFVYAHDGRLRFSQTSVQQQNGKFSYINYDRMGRAVETGEYSMATNPAQGFRFENLRTANPAANSVLNILENITRGGGLDATRCGQRNQIWYDEPWQDAQLNGRKQEFVLGGIAKTQNDVTTTWYSYDEFGKVSWLVQNAPVVGVKTVDYTYDFLGNVLEVAYQKGAADAFYHHYRYDADQRMTTVQTSSDGLNKTLQAKYLYYLHGPLKRAELADRLQGVDYTYTVQGWLKNINHVSPRLDPGHDSPRANGVPKDLFSLTLDYYSSDYRSKDLPVIIPQTTAGPADRFDGTLRDVAWATTPNADRHLHTFHYDEKSQLLRADHHKISVNGAALQALPNAGGLEPYQEGNLSYDLNGNLGSLRRRDGSGIDKDNFTYEYATGTNKLGAVRSQLNPTGPAILDYDYDLIGQMTRQRDEQGQRYLSYNMNGNVTGVYKDLAFLQPLVTFTYNDKGFRASKATYSATTNQLVRTTHYVRDGVGTELSIYEQDVTPGSVLQRTEVPLYGSGRIGTLVRLDNGTNDARYELNDQLGNARLVFHRPTTTTYLATMAPSQSQREEQEFTNLPATRFATAVATDGYVARLSAATGSRYGPSKTLTVEKGDTITLSANAFFRASGLGRSSIQAFPIISIQAGEQYQGAKGTDKPSLQGPRKGSGVQVGVGFGSWAARQPNPPTTGVLAYLHYKLKNVAGTVIDEQYEPVDVATPDAWQTLALGVRTPEAGTLELSVESEDPARVVYFDDIRVEQTGSTILQEQHTYAFGAPLTGLNYTIGSKRYRQGYQGQFAEKDEETGWESFELRSYDSRIGRWISADPASQFNSPYVGMGNNPVSGVDPDGGWMWSWVGAGAGAVAGGIIGGLSNDGEWSWKRAGAGAGIGLVAGGILGGIGDEPGPRGAHTANGWDHIQSFFREGKLRGGNQYWRPISEGNRYTGVLQKRTYYSNVLHSKAASGGIFTTAFFFNNQNFGSHLQDISFMALSASAVTIYANGKPTMGNPEEPAQFKYSGQRFVVSIKTIIPQMGESGIGMVKDAWDNLSIALPSAPITAAKSNVRTRIRVKRMPYKKIPNNWSRMPSTSFP